MDKEIEKQVRVVLEDDNELMAMMNGQGSNLDDENKRMNRELIERHEKILDKVDRGERLTKGDLELIRDANEIYLNDEDNVAGHYKEAVVLGGWLDKMLKVVGGERVFDKKGKCLKRGSRVALADVTDTIVFVGDEIVKRYDEDITNRNCVRCNYAEHDKVGR